MSACLLLGLLLPVPLSWWQATVNWHLCQRLPNTHSTSGSVSCGITASFSWVLVCTRFCLHHPRVSISPVQGSSVAKYRWPSKSDSLGIFSPFARSTGWEVCHRGWDFCISVRTSLVIVLQFVGCPPGGSMVGLLATSSKRPYATCHASQDCCCQWSYPFSRPLLRHASTEDPQTLTGRSGPVSCGSLCSFPWVLGHARFCLCPPGVSGWYEVWFILSILILSTPWTVMKRQKDMTLKGEW